MTSSSPVADVAGGDNDRSCICQASLLAAFLSIASENEVECGRGVAAELEDNPPRESTGLDGCDGIEEDEWERKGLDAAADAVEARELKDFGTVKTVSDASKGEVAEYDTDREGRGEGEESGVLGVKLWLSILRAWLLRCCASTREGRGVMEGHQFL